MKTKSPDRAAIVVTESEMPPNGAIVMLEEVDVLTEEVVIELVKAESAHAEPASEFSAATAAAAMPTTLGAAVVVPMPPRRITLRGARPSRPSSSSASASLKSAQSPSATRMPANSSPTVNRVRRNSSSTQPGLVASALSPFDDVARASFCFHADGEVPDLRAAEPTIKEAGGALRTFYASSVAQSAFYNVMGADVAEHSCWSAYFVGRKYANDDVRSFEDKASFHVLLACATNAAGVVYDAMVKLILTSQAFLGAYSVLFFGTVVEADLRAVIGELSRV